MEERNKEAGLDASGARCACLGKLIHFLQEQQYTRLEQLSADSGDLHNPDLVLLAIKLAAPHIACKLPIHACVLW